jgi:cell division protein FtsW
LGTIAFLVTSKIDYKHWRGLGFYFFIGSLVLTALVFVPEIGFSHGGATRWIDLKLFTFQPSELLKVSFVIYLAAWLSSIRDKVSTLKFGLFPFWIMVGLVGILLLKQPDTDTFGVIVFAGLAMFISAGGKWRHILATVLVGIVVFGAIALTRPYVMSRIETFFKPAENSLGSSYQLQQSLIAVGSGGIVGRGFGQSVQKFNYLPEPIGDSIFAVAAEEFGFVGSVILILLFVFFAVRGLKIATRAPDSFGRLVVVGIVILIISQAYINIAGMLGVIPLTGIPLPFVSHGGTALFIALAEVGIIVNISKHQRNID